MYWTQIIVVSKDMPCVKTSDIRLTLRQNNASDQKVCVNDRRPKPGNSTRSFEANMCRLRLPKRRQAAKKL